MGMRLLTGTESNLGDVDLGSLRPGGHHDLEVVEVREALLGAAARLVPSLVQNPVHLVLERLAQGVAGRRLQLIVVGLLDHLYDIVLGLGRSCDNHVTVML